MNNSMLLTNLADATSVVAGGALPLGTAVHGFGSAIKLNGNAITITAPGYYQINVSASVAVVGTGEETLTLVRNGVATTASASATPAAAGEVVNLSFPFVVRKNCCGDALTLSFILSAAAAVNTAIVEVVKL